MASLLDTPAARAWVKIAIQRHSDGIFGKLSPAVIWSDRRGDDGELLVAVDPQELVKKINSTPFIILHNHDPGKPKGQTLESAVFQSESGGSFVAAILGFYAGGKVLDFQRLGLDTTTPGVPPKQLPILPDNVWIQIEADPREVDSAWLDEITEDAPLEVERTELSHNAADSTNELIRIGLVYLSLVWNPFVTSVASEAGKTAYSAVHEWIRKLLKKLAERRDPILDIHSFQSNCQVSFIFRGKDVKQHYSAHDKLSGAAVQAAQLIEKLEARGMAVRRLVYEFDKEALLWYPAYAILGDDRIITDHIDLIATEQLPSGLSLGLSRGEATSSVIK
jgi:hypothetical protein